MMDYDTAQPNARFWTLDLLKRSFSPGDQLSQTTVENAGLYAQAFQTNHGKVLLIINKRNHAQQVMLPADASGASLSYVAPSTNDHAATNSTLTGRTLSVEPFEVAVVQFK
jgi:hypothetical protein